LDQDKPVSNLLSLPLFNYVTWFGDPDDFDVGLGGTPVEGRSGGGGNALFDVNISFIQVLRATTTYQNYLALYRNDRG